MKIAILNAKYSPNLGDGAIAECLEFQLKKRIENLEIFSLDIGGSEDYGGSNSMIPESGVGSLFAKLPAPLQKLMRYYLRPLMLRRKYFRKWQEKLKDCDGIIIGGGHLFMDVQRYFPARISMAVLAARKNIPLFVYATGVSESFSREGKALFNKAFSHGRLCYVSVRDEKSKINWEHHFPETKANVTLDPALLAAETYGIKKTAESDRVHVLLGVSDPDNMKAHADNPDALKTGEIAFYKELNRLLEKEGMRVTLFTNGGDDEYLKKVSAALPNVRALGKAGTPKELAEQIGTANVLVAHRLHANILAYALGIPSVGLMWDRKVESFFALTERQKFLVKENSPELVLKYLKDAISEKLNEGVRAATIGKAAQGIDALSKAIQSNV